VALLGKKIIIQASLKPVMDVEILKEENIWQISSDHKI